MRLILCQDVVGFFEQFCYYKKKSVKYQLQNTKLLRTLILPNTLESKRNLLVARRLILLREFLFLDRSTTLYGIGSADCSLTATASTRKSVMIYYFKLNQTTHPKRCSNDTLITIALDVTQFAHFLKALTNS